MDQKQRRWPGRRASDSEKGCSGLELAAALCPPSSIETLLAHQWMTRNPRRLSVHLQQWVQHPKFICPLLCQKTKILSIRVQNEHLSVKRSSLASQVRAIAKKTGRLLKKPPSSTIPLLLQERSSMPLRDSCTPVFGTPYDRDRDQEPLRTRRNGRHLGLRGRQLLNGLRRLHNEMRHLSLRL